MSEYQYVAFRAIDAPVSEADLDYMRSQSSRAEITPRAFTNEYHFGDFHGNAMKMLRRGYDIHLHFANFGTRRLCIRLPQGFPDPKAAKPYLNPPSLDFAKDSRGSGGILVIDPYYEPGDLEDLWDMGAMLDRLIPLREEILEGDLRPLYLAHLAVACDGNHDPDDTVEAPVPAGLSNPTPAQQTLADLYGISDALISAAGKVSPSVPSKGDTSNQYARWLGKQSEATKNAWLIELMNGSASNLRAEILARFRSDRPQQTWPTMRSGRTIAELQVAARNIQQEMDRKTAAQASRRRAAKLVKMAADPASFLLETEQLAKRRSTDAYQEAARILVDLREALADTGQADLAERQARKLKKEHPTLNHLTAALRREGFIPK